MSRQACNLPLRVMKTKEERGFANAICFLTDASVTQSAMEEVLASDMQGGYSLRGTISAAFRGSRYLPGGSNP